MKFSTLLLITLPFVAAVSINRGDISSSDIALAGKPGDQCKGSGASECAVVKKAVEADVLEAEVIEAEIKHSFARASDKCPYDLCTLARESCEKRGISNRRCMNRMCGNKHCKQVCYPCNYFWTETETEPDTGETDVVEAQASGTLANEEASGVASAEQAQGTLDCPIPCNNRYRQCLKWYPGNVEKCTKLGCANQQCKKCTKDPVCKALLSEKDVDTPTEESVVKKAIAPEADDIGDQISNTLDTQGRYDCPPECYGLFAPCERKDCMRCGLCSKSAASDVVPTLVTPDEIQVGEDESQSNTLDTQAGCPKHCFGLFYACEQFTPWWGCLDWMCKRSDCKKCKNCITTSVPDDIPTIDTTNAVTKKSVETPDAVHVEEDESQTNNTLIGTRACPQICYTKYNSCKKYHPWLLCAGWMCADIKQCKKCDICHFASSVSDVVPTLDTASPVTKKPDAVPVDGLEAHIGDTLGTQVCPQVCWNRYNSCRIFTNPLLCIDRMCQHLECRQNCGNCPKVAASAVAATPDTPGPLIKKAVENPDAVSVDNLDAQFNGGLAGPQACPKACSDTWNECRGDGHDPRLCLDWVCQGQQCKIGCGC